MTWPKQVVLVGIVAGVGGTLMPDFVSGGVLGFVVALCGLLDETWAQERRARRAEAEAEKLRGPTPRGEG